MTLFTFDAYNQTEIPNIYLANPNGKILYNLGTIYNRNFSLRFNTLSELSFTAPSMIEGTDNDFIVSDYYDYLEYRRLVCVENIGNFMITKIEIKNDGLMEIKEVTCQSLEVMLTYKKVTLLEGVYTFNSTKTIGGQSTTNLMQTLMSYIPDWTFDEDDMSQSLAGLTRTFEVTDKSLYDFMVNEISQTFQCVFVFDTINKVIHAYTLEQATTPTDIYISLDNLIKSLSVSESTEELATALTVLGGEDLGINLVNPIGSNTIYNFDYYKDTEWMEQSLIDALNAWEDKIDANQEVYADYLTEYRESNACLVTLQSEYDILDNYYVSLKTILDNEQLVYASGSVIPNYLLEISASMTALSGSMTAKQVEINTQTATSNGIWGQILDIHTDLEFENNFTNQQLADLDAYIVGNTYTNTNFIHTDEMTEVEVQDEAQNLYDQGQVVLAKVSEPRYTFGIDSANFAFIKEYEPFIEQLQLGCTITVELGIDSSGSPITTVPVLLGIDFSYDDPSSFSLILSNRLRLDDKQFQYSDLFSSMVDSATTTNFNSQKWNRISNAIDTISPDTNLVASIITTSGSHGLAVFSDTSGGKITDLGGVYVPPTSFTPSLVSGSTSASATFTYDYNMGCYTVIGRELFFEIAISLAGISGSAANKSIYVTLPAFHKNTSNLTTGFPVLFQGITLNTGFTNVMAYLPNNSASLVLKEQGSAVASADILCTKLNSTTASFVINGHYLIN